MPTTAKSLSRRFSPRLKTVADRLEGSNIGVAAQNCSTEIEEGAHTGEVLAAMLRDVGRQLCHRRAFGAAAALF